MFLRASMRKYTFLTILFTACLWLVASTPGAEAKFNTHVIGNALKELKLDLNATIWSKLSKNQRQVYLEKVQHFRMCYNTTVGRQHIDIFNEKLPSIVEKYFIVHKYYGNNKTVRQRVRRVLRFLKTLGELAKQVLSCMIDVSNGKKPTVYGLTSLTGMSPTEFSNKMLIPNENLLGSKPDSSDKSEIIDISYEYDKNGVRKEIKNERKLINLPQDGCQNAKVDDYDEAPRNLKKCVGKTILKSSTPGNKNRLIIEDENNRTVINPFLIGFKNFPHYDIKKAECDPVLSDSYYRSKPDSFSWQDKNILSEIRNQGFCGSCWAFNAIDLVETNHRRWNNVTFDENYNQTKDIRLSTQDIIDCGMNACTGDNPGLAMRFMHHFGSAPEESNPYTATYTADGECVAHKPIFRLKKYCENVQLTGNIENSLKTLLLDNGPLLVAIEAGLPVQNLRGPFHGVLHHNLGHALMLIGWNREYWIMKNSWGDAWGIDGYLYMGKEVDCGLEYMIQWMYESKQ